MAPAMSAKKQGKQPSLKTDSLSFANAPLLSTPSLSEYTNLHKLDLSNCGLKELSFVKEARRTLTWLNVSGNVGLDWDGVESLSGLFVLNASHCGLDQVPPQIESLHYLKALVLSHNNLKELAHIRRLPNLNTLVVSNNQLTSLPSALTTLPSLKKLSCAHNLLTPSSLPDLTPLTHLREILLNTNPSLTSLPDHFATWGKGVEGEELERGAGRGLEILDIGNCGVENWGELRALGGQRGLVSLGLKGTVLEKEGLEDGGLEGFRAKLLILLPSLRILSNVRFDTKFHDLKQKRLERAPDQKILDAGPMAWKKVLGEQPENDQEEEDEEKERKRGKKDENKIKELRKMRRLVEEKLREREREKEAALSSEPAKESTEGEGKKSKKRKSSSTTSDEPAPSTSSATLDDSTPKVKKPRKKNRHERLEPTPFEPEATVSSDRPPPPSVVEAPELPKKKRGRKSKSGVETVPAATKEPDTETMTAEEPPKKRKKKSPGGVLSALRGDGTEPEEPKKIAQPPPPIADKEKEKEARSSVVKVVEVKKKRDAKDMGTSLDDLLGLGGKSAVEGTEEVGGGSAWD